MNPRPCPCPRLYLRGQGRDFKPMVGAPDAVRYVRPFHPPVGHVLCIWLGRQDRGFHTDVAGRSGQVDPAKWRPVLGK